MVFFIPKRAEVFDKLVDLSNIISQVAQRFNHIINDWSKLNDGVIMLGELENVADEYVHIITDYIEKTFILPIDKEDLKDLTEKMDNIVDNLEQAANKIFIYKISESNQVLKNFFELIFEAIEYINKGIIMIKDNKLKSKELLFCIEKLHELENRGDKLHRKILEKMLGEKSPEFGGNDPIMIIKWKDIFQTLEDTLDGCEDFAVLFSRFRIKYK